MKVKNQLQPNQEQLDGFLKGDTEAPIAMLNLLKFKILRYSKLYSF